MPEFQLWCMFFVSVVSMARHHPGHVKNGTVLSLQDCVREADEMLAIAIAKEMSWRGSDQQ